MSENLNTLRTGLAEIDQLIERQKSLESDQAELSAKVRYCTASVAAGDKKAVNELATAKARLDQLPGELEALQRDLDAAVDQLRQLLPGVAVEVAKAYGREYRRIFARCQRFLEKSTGKGHFANEYARLITERTKSVVHLDGLRHLFHAGATLQTSSAQNVVCRARSAVEACAAVL